MPRETPVTVNEVGQEVPWEEGVQAMLYSLSPKLGQRELDTIHELERDLGKPVLAFSAVPAEPAPVGPEQLAKVREVERSLGVTLVVVDRANRD